MSTLKENGMYKRTFAEFLAKKHPEIKLQEWQIKVLNILLNQPIAAGKTLLIKLLAEYDTPGFVRGLPGNWLSYRDGRHLAQERNPMERYKNKRMMFRSGNGEFRAPKAADMGIGGVCKVCGHLLLETYEGDKNKRFVDPMKFRYRCFTCEPESGPTPFAPDKSGLVLAQAEPVKEVLSPVESEPL